MTKSDLVECYFLDGPQRGTTKWLNRADMQRSRTYVTYDPVQYEPPVEFSLDRKTCKVPCYRTEYCFFPIPSSYGSDRFVMLQQPGLGV